MKHCHRSFSFHTLRVFSFYATCFYFSRHVIFFTYRKNFFSAAKKLFFCCEKNFSSLRIVENKAYGFQSLHFSFLILALLEVQFHVQTNL